MTKIIFGIILLFWGFCQIFTFIKYNYDERKRLYELYGNKEIKK